MTNRTVEIIEEPAETPLGRELVVPDPRVQTVPKGWWEDYALPVVQRAGTFRELDDLQWKVQAVADYLASARANRFEFEAALRVIEARKGELLGDRRKSPRVESTDDTDSSEGTKHRWRTLAANWVDVVRPAIEAAAAKDEPSYRDVSQAKLLRACESNGQREPVAEQRQDPTSVEDAQRRRAVMAMAEAMWWDQFDPTGTAGTFDDEGDWEVVVRMAEVAWEALQVGPGGRWRVRALEGESG